jgi:hypothetical protein
MLPRVIFDVSCGDWVYPSRDSSASVKYDIDFPLVAMIYRPKSDINKPLERSGRIDFHLTGPRYLSCEIVSGKAVTDHSLKVLSLKNEREEAFE